MIPFKRIFSRSMIIKIFYISLILLTICATQSIYFPELIYGNSLILRWNSNDEDDLAGYKVYYGTESKQEYAWVEDLGNVTQCDLWNLSLDENESYIIALTAYDIYGNESDFSDPLLLIVDDGIDDFEDNCPYIYNPNQEDTFPPQGNGLGDACECEGNFDCDKDCDGTDAATFKLDFGRSYYNNFCESGNPCKGDFTCDGDVDGADAAHFKLDFGRNQFNNPCPSCTTLDWCVEINCAILCGNGRCDPCEDCEYCPEDCAGEPHGKPINRFCCGDGIPQITEEDGAICDGNY